MVYFGNKKSNNIDNRVEQLEQQFKKSKVVLDLALSSGTQTTGTVGGNITIYMTQITQNLFGGNDLNNLVGCYVFHPNGTIQTNRMMTFGYQVQFYSQDTTKQGILITGISTGTYNDAFYKQLKVRLIFDNATIYTTP